MVVEKAVWDDQYNLGVEAIDKAHANLSDRGKADGLGEG